MLSDFLDHLEQSWKFRIVVYLCDSVQFRLQHLRKNAHQMTVSQALPTLRQLCTSWSVHLHNSVGDLRLKDELVQRARLLTQFLQDPVRVRLVVERLKLPYHQEMLPKLEFQKQEIERRYQDALRVLREGRDRKQREIDRAIAFRKQEIHSLKQEQQRISSRLFR